MSERKLQTEINRINGALEVLGLLRERLRNQRDEIIRRLYSPEL